MRCFGFTLPLSVKNDLNNACNNIGKGTEYGRVTVNLSLGQ
jgi:hypothetical protein